MRVTATLMALAKDAANGVSWTSQVCGRSLLAIGVQTAREIPLIDDLAILTDDPALLAQGECLGAPVKEMWPWSVKHRMDFLTCDAFFNYQQRVALEKSGMLGDVHFFLDWRLPLLPARTYERMYHRLLEHRVAARVIPIYPEDPNLYTPSGPDPDMLFAVWAHPGRDRQYVPQLYRAFGACVAHMRRLELHSPLTIGFEAPLVQCLEATSPEQMEIIRYAERCAGGLAQCGMRP